MINTDKVTQLKEQLSAQNAEPAYEALYRMCFPPLMRFAYSFIQSHELAEEIAADVLIRVWKNRERLGDVTDFRLYLYVSTRNTAFNYLKRQKKVHALSLDETALWLKTDDVTPEVLLITTELTKKIQDAIKNLPPRCRLIYKLVKEDNLKYKEVATLLDLSVKTIEAQMGIALKRLYQTFRHFMNEPRYAEKQKSHS